MLSNLELYNKLACRLVKFETCLGTNSVSCFIFSYCFNSGWVSSDTSFIQSHNCEQVSPQGPQKPASTPATGSLNGGKKTSARLVHQRSLTSPICNDMYMSMMLETCQYICKVTHEHHIHYIPFINRDFLPQQPFHSLLRPSWHVVPLW